MKSPGVLHHLNIMNIFRDRRTFHAAMVILSMALFGYFAGNELLSFSALLAAGIFIYLAASEHPSPLELFGLSPGGRNTITWITAGVVISVILSLYCRFHFTDTLLPRITGLIAVSFIMIGMTEELVYRGFIQGILSHHHPATGILVASAGHTVYKAALLGTSPVSGMINLAGLAALTFIAGCLFGYFRFRSGQIYPALVAHGLFDLLVYGDQADFPLWVWH